jgi:hypothetical protein
LSSGLSAQGSTRGTAWAALEALVAAAVAPLAGKIAIIAMVALARIDKTALRIFDFFLVAQAYCLPPDGSW